MSVTIGITCYNAKDTIGRCIESALDTIGDDDEILIVDDNSSDASVEVIIEYLGDTKPKFKDDAKRKGLSRVTNDSNIRLVRHNINMGVAEARNTLIEHARGDFIAFLDDDDECKSNRLHLQQDRLLEAEKVENNKYVLCFGDRETLESGGQSSYIEAIARQGKPVCGAIGIDYILYGKRAQGFTFGRYGSGTLFGRVDTLKKIDGFNEEYRRCEDGDLAIRLLQIGGILVSASKPVIIQHITKSTTSEKGYRVEKRFYKKLLKDRKSYLGNKYYYGIFRNYRRIAKAHGKIIRYYLYLSISLLSAPSRILNKFFG